MPGKSLIEPARAFHHAIRKGPDGRGVPTRFGRAVAPPFRVTVEPVKSDRVLTKKK